MTKPAKWVRDQGRGGRSGFRVWVNWAQGTLTAHAFGAQG